MQFTVTLVLDADNLSEADEWASAISENEEGITLLSVRHTTPAESRHVEAKQS